jgi:uncharacterized coiled-coil protein SlyX
VANVADIAAVFMYDDWQRRNKVYTVSKRKWMMAEQQIELIRLEMNSSLAHEMECYEAKSSEILEGMQKYIDNLESRIAKYEDEIDLLWPAWREQQRTIEELTKKVEMLSKMMIRDTRYATADGTYGDTTDTWLGNTYAAITSCVETTVQDLRAFMEAFENYDQSQIHLIDIQEKQRKRTIQPNRYKYARPIVKSDYRAIYRHQAR